MCAIWQRRSAISSGRTRSCPRRRATTPESRPCPTSPTCAGRSAGGERSSWRRPAAAICCSRARPARGRRCSGAGCRRSSRPSEGARRSRSRVSTPSRGRWRPGPASSRRLRSGPAPRSLPAAVIGGGAVPRPGEVSLAHCGVLLLDELPEFPRSVLEALRQPLEDGVVSVARVGGRALFPARFRLVATMNLCPCGGRGDPWLDRVCRPLASPHTGTRSRGPCSTGSTSRRLPRPPAEEPAAGPFEPSVAVRARVVDGLRASSRRRRGDSGGRRSCSTAPSTGRRSPGGDGRVSRGSPARWRLAGSVDVRPSTSPRRSRTDHPRAHEPKRGLLPRRRDEGYPRLLAEIPDPPARLWLRGDASLTCWSGPPSRSSAPVPAPYGRAAASSRRGAARRARSS